MSRSDYNAKVCQYNNCIDLFCLGSIQGLTFVFFHPDYRGYLSIGDFGIQLCCSKNYAVGIQVIIMELLKMYVCISLYSDVTFVVGIHLCFSQYLENYLWPNFDSNQVVLSFSSLLRQFVGRL